MRGEKILIIKLGALGDFVQAIGAMRAIRNYHPQAHITLLTTQSYIGLGKQCGLFDDIWTDTRPKWHQPKAWVAIKKKLDGGQFTRVYDLQNNDRTALYFKLMTPKPEWVGTAKGASHENDAPSRTAGHSFEGHRQTLALAGITDIPIDTLMWMQADTARFNLPRPYALIVPGASPKRPLKRWPVSYYATLCKMLAHNHITPVILGSRHEIPLAHEIVNGCESAIDLTGKTDMNDIPALAREARCAIGNDTGPMHMIAPTGCASLVLFSRDSDPIKHKPLGARVYTLQQADLSDMAPNEVWTALERYGML